MEEGYQFAHRWLLQNTSGSCNANEYYLAPQSAQISYDQGSTWQSYSGMNFQFYRSSPPNQSNVLQSDRFSINGGQVDDLEIQFNVSPTATGVRYRVFFDIFDANNNLLPPLDRGRLFTDFNYYGSVPDLEIQSASVTPETMAAGDQVTINFTVKNVGFSTTVPSNVRIRYSSNTGYSSTNDPILGGSISVGSLDPGQSQSFSVTRTIPANAQDGNRYLFLVADAFNVIAESSEGSANRERLSIQVASNLISDIYIDNVIITPDPIAWGDQLQVTFDQAYSGNENNLPSVTARVYISQDCSISSDDILFETVSSSIDAEDTSDPETADVTIGMYPPGTYVLIIEADADDEVAEINEDNIFCYTFEISGAVNYSTVGHSVSSTTVQAGNDISVNCQIAGNGTDRVYIGYFLSTNCSFDPSLDIYLDDDNHDFSNSSIAFESATLTIPANTPAGTYVLIIYTDYEFEIAETNETDNIHCIYITVTNTCTPPVANYFQSDIEVTQGGGIYFNDNSTDANSWSWTFGSGAPSTYDDRYPATVTFDEYGDHIISLTVSNACGTDTKTTTIRVNPDQELPPTPHSVVCNPSNAGDPVNMSTGAYVYAVEDLQVRGINGNYSWRRFYDSSLDYEGSLGQHWTHSYDIHLNIDGNSWTVQYGNGQRTHYAGYNDGIAIPLYEGTLSTLTKNTATNQYTFTKTDGTVYVFNSDGCIETITNRVGNLITFNHLNCQLTRVTFPGGRYFDLTYTGDRLTQVTDNSGRFVTYGYSGNQQNLVSSTDVRGGMSTMTYDAAHHLITQVDPRGHTVVSNTYDGNGRVIAQSDALGYATLFAYDTPVAGATTMTNALNGTQIHYHNAKYRLTQFVNELGKSIFLGYDGPTSKIKSYRDEAGNTTFYDLDNAGNLSLIQDVLANQTTITFNNLNLPTTITNALGYVTTIGYDGVGNPITLTLPNGAVYTSTYNAVGQIVTRTTPNGNSITYLRNGFGDVVTIQTPTGNYILTVDDLGRITSSTDRNGNTTTFELDPAGNITRITDALGYFIMLTYDANGNLTSYQDKEGAITTLVYNQRNELITVTDALGYTKYFVYDGLGRIISTTDANGNVVTLGYDAKGQLITITNDLGTYSMSYDVTGNVIDITDAEGNTYEIEYDEKHRPIITRDPLGNENEFVYDALDQLLSATDANGNTTTNTFDEMGWLESITDALGGMVQYSRDLEGNLTDITDANGNTTTNTFDPQGRNTVTIYPGGYSSSSTFDNEGYVATNIDENGLVTTVLRDANYNLTGLTFSNGESYGFTNDKEGRLLDMTNSAGITSTTRNARGEIIEVDDPFGNTIGLGYDGNGNRTYTAYQAGDTVTTTFNTLNLPVTVTDWLGNSSQRSYNSNGELTGISNSNGTTTAIIRDALGRITDYTNYAPDLSVIN
ncbi:MAG: CARDB domain-containing protein, partial [Bacteroidota bacterium]